MTKKPSKERLDEAIGTIEDLIAYLKENEPYATNSISKLESVIEELEE